MRISDWSSDVCSSDLLDRRDERDHRPGGAVRNEQRKEMQLVAPETDDQNDREGQHRQHAGNGEVAGDRQRMQAAQRKRHHSQYVAEHYERSEEHTSELQSLMRISYAVLCLKTKKPQTPTQT